MDGISTLLILLTTLLGTISILGSWSAIQDRVRQFYVFMLLLQTGMIGTFCSLDMFLFYVFWEVMLIPMYFVIGIWGGERRVRAAVKFFLFTMAGSLVMLIGILWLGWSHAQVAGEWSFRYEDLLRLALPAGQQVWLFAAFALAFAIKDPMFPFHTWLPDAHTGAPTVGSVVLAAVLLKMGTYGFIR